MFDMQCRFCSMYFGVLCKVVLACFSMFLIERFIVTILHMYFIVLSDVVLTC